MGKSLVSCFFLRHSVHTYRPRLRTAVHDASTVASVVNLLTLPRAEQVLCNGMVSVCLSRCGSRGIALTQATGLRQPGAQQRMRAVPCLQPRAEAEHRLVLTVASLSHRSFVHLGLQHVALMASRTERFVCASLLDLL